VEGRLAEGVWERGARSQTLRSGILRLEKTTSRPEDLPGQRGVRKEPESAGVTLKEKNGGPENDWDSRRKLKTKKG